jgi:hypothetical protein
MMNKRPSDLSETRILTAMADLIAARRPILDAEDTFRADQWATRIKGAGRMK